MNAMKRYNSDFKHDRQDGLLLNLAAFVVVIAGVKAISGLVIPLLLATFFAIILSPLMLWFRKKGVPSPIAMILVLVIFIAIEAGLAAIIGGSFRDFTDNLPFYQDRLSAMYSDFLVWARSKGVAEESLHVLKEIDPSQVMGFAATTLRGLGKLVTNTFMIMLLLIFILIEAGGMVHKMKLLARMGVGSESYVESIVSGINSFFAIKTLTSLATGVLVGVGLWIQGVDFPVLWGLVAFLLNYIPTIGSIIASVPAVMLSAIQLGLVHSLVTALIFFGVNTLIGSIIEPRIMGRGVGLSPLVVFLSMAFWGWVFGPVGMLLSVPLTMLFKIALSKSHKGLWLAVLLGTNKEAEVMIDSGVPVYAAPVSEDKTEDKKDGSASSVADTRSDSPDSP